MNIEQIIKEKYGIDLPAPSKPGGIYAPVKRTGNLLYLSGQTCTHNDEMMYCGVVGDDLSVEEGQKAAAYCAVNLISALGHYLNNDWTRFVQIVQLVGYVRSANGFKQQPQVINGASQLFVDAFGEAGLAARLALGTNELPGGAAVEVAIIVEIKAE